MGVDNELPAGEIRFTSPSYSVTKRYNTVQVIQCKQLYCKYQYQWCHENWGPFFHDSNPSRTLIHILYAKVFSHLVSRWFSRSKNSKVQYPQHCGVKLSSIIETRVSMTLRSQAQQYHWNRGVNDTAEPSSAVSSKPECQWHGGAKLSSIIETRESMTRRSQAQQYH